MSTLSREQQQFILDILADVCSKQHGVSMSFILKEPDEASDESAAEEERPSA